MKASHLLQAFQDVFSASFSHTARYKYNIEFKDSNVSTYIEDLEILRRKVELGQGNDVKVGFNITLEHVIYLENVLRQIIERYTQAFGVRPNNFKWRDVSKKLIDYETLTPEEIAKQVLEITLKSKNEPEEELSIDEQQDRDAEIMRKNRKYDYLSKKRKSKANQRI
jgi:hypothetical protein